MEKEKNSPLVILERLAKESPETPLGRLYEIKKNQKKFQEYKKRIAKIVYDFEVIPFAAISRFKADFSDEVAWMLNYTDLASLFARTLYMHFDDHKPTLNYKETPEEPYKNYFFTSTKLSKEDLNKLCRFFDGEPLPYGEKTVKYAEMFDDEFTSSCESLLNWQLVQDDNMNIDNFLFSVSSKRVDEDMRYEIGNKITRELTPRLFSDIFILFSSSLNKSFEEEEIKKIREERDELKKELKRKEAELKEREEEVKEKNDKISSLSSQLLKKEEEGEKEREEEIEALSEENKNLIRQNKKMDSLYSDLFSKYRKLKERVEEGGEEIEEEEKVEEMKEIDLNARYLFFMGADIKCRTQIKEMFPNAEFTDRSSNFSLTAYDMVVIMTGCVDHKHYWRIKEQCKIHNIPFVHSHHSNLDIIKNAIWNVLN